MKKAVKTNVFYLASELAAQEVDGHNTVHEMMRCSAEGEKERKSVCGTMREIACQKICSTVTDECLRAHEMIHW